MTMQSFRTIPVLGLKTAVAENDQSLLRMVSETTALTYDTGGVNVDYHRFKGACSKAYGSVQWSASANAQATKCLGLFELYDGTNRNHLIFDNGKVFLYNSNRTPVALTDVGDSTFNQTVNQPYSIIPFGGYVIFADYGTTTPMKWVHGAANLTKLILSGTEYKFRYLQEFQRRVIGAYSDQTNGDIEIRFTDALPAWATLSFPTANQLFKPEGDDSITGLKKLGANALYLYSDDSISRVDYYPDAAAPFGMTTMVAGYGCTNHSSIVSVGNAHYLFNKDLGFCAYSGGTEFPAGGRPISEDIETDLAGMNSAYYGAIVGEFVPFTQEICWTVPLIGDTTPSHLLFFNITDGTWRKESKPLRFVDTWLTFPDYTWNNLITDLGGTGAVWTAATTNSWAKYAAQLHRLVYANIDGHLYYQASESDNGSDIDAYRIEPVMDFGSPVDRDLLLELWFGVVYAADFLVDVYHRSGDTVGECTGASWTSLGSVDCNSPDNAVLYCSENNRFHQIKWGTDKADERFVVNKIVYKFVRQGPY